MAGEEIQRVGGGAETHFAKKLASNEKTVRDKAIKKLRVWISTRRSVSSGWCVAYGESRIIKLKRGYKHHSPTNNFDENHRSHNSDRTQVRNVVKFLISRASLLTV